MIVYRNRHHKKVSVLGAVVYEPARNRFSVICDFHPDTYVRSGEAASFVHRLLAEFPGLRIDLVWDQLNAHRSKLVKELSEQHDRLRFHFLSGYAPDLNPAEMLWCLSKNHRLANHAIDNVPELEREANRVINKVASQESLLVASLKQAGLALWEATAQ